MTDAIAILAIILLNGCLGFVQEWKAEKSLEALQKMLSPQCRVVRGGQDAEIDSVDLVPGDLVRLKIGDRVPADLRLIKVVDLLADESALTGESISVQKTIHPADNDSDLTDRGSMSWMGSTITNGRALGLVTSTGMSTEFGRVAQLTQELDRESTPLQKKLGILGKQLGLLAISVSSLIAIAGFLAGRPLTEMVMVGISLAVAVVPEGLPAIVTITLALGVGAMVRRRALLRRLQAAETLGAATVICTDKTGTLTQNEMTVARIWIPRGSFDVMGVGYTPQGEFQKDGVSLDPRQNPDLMELLNAGFQCNQARLVKEDGQWSLFGEPTEGSLLVAAMKAGFTDADKHKPCHEFSFNSLRKRMSVIVHENSHHTVYLKGAPEIVIDRCSRLKSGDEVQTLTELDRQSILAATASFADEGLRTLALSYRVLPEETPFTEDEVEQDLILLGVVGIFDPPRAEVHRAIDTARAANVKIVMITGDASATAVAIARRIGLDVTGEAITRAELIEMDDEELAQHIEGGGRFLPERLPKIKCVLSAFCRTNPTLLA